MNEFKTDKVTLYTCGIAVFSKSKNVTKNNILVEKKKNINSLLNTAVVKYSEPDIETKSISFKTPNSLDSHKGQVNFKDNIEEFLLSITGMNVSIVHRLNHIAGVDTESGVIAFIQREVGDNVGRVGFWTTSDSLKFIDIPNIESVEFRDDDDNRRVGTEVLSQSNSSYGDLKSVLIQSRCPKKGMSQNSQIFVDYATSYPVWKSSYNINVRDGKFELIMNALVSNETNQDWSDVEVELISGLPYSSYYQLEDLKFFSQASSDRRAKTSKSRMKGIVLESQFTRSISNVDDHLGVEQNNHAVEVGDFFSYQVREPVSVKKSDSAMIPFARVPFWGDHVSYHIMGESGSYANSAVYLRNNTQMVLEEGPVSVEIDGVHMGASLLDRVSNDEKRILSYAIDFNLTVKDKGQVKTSKNIIFTYDNGSLLLSREINFNRVVNIKNKSSKDKRLFIDFNDIPHNKDVAQKSKNIKFYGKFNRKSRYDFSIPGKSDDLYNIAFSQEAPYQKLKINDDNESDIFKSLGQVLEEVDIQYVENEAICEWYSNFYSLKNKIDKLNSKTYKINNEIRSFSDQRMGLRDSLKGLLPEDDLRSDYLHRIQKIELGLKKLHDTKAEWNDVAESYKNHRLEILNDLIGVLTSLPDNKISLKGF
jgi:hypothetical protein